jgi:hypothetical protein
MPPEFRHPSPRGNRPRLSCRATSQARLILGMALGRGTWSSRWTLAWLTPAGFGTGLQRRMSPFSTHTLTCRASQRGAPHLILNVCSSRLAASAARRTVLSHCSAQAPLDPVHCTSRSACDG